MSNSALATARYPAHANNYWGDRQGTKIDRIIIHHMAATWTAKRCCESFQDPKRGASANYCIGKDGEIAVCVDEVYASGCSSNRDADMHGITIEVGNNVTGGQWTVSDKALTSLIKLCADIAKRNGLGKLVKGKNLCWHQMYAATACPGPYLISKLDLICDEVNKNNYPEKKENTEVKIVGITGINKARGANDLI
ncbi:MAG: N-acetylmuramoyl-L-alanine amidase, partial [Lachnospiraceae bacterium]|nr:N-acetylmuramoyl-L-alanine amidase [Lachnospiraceae bacterium]